MQRPDIEQFLRDTLSDMFRLAPRKRISQNEAVKLIADQWLKDRKAYHESLMRHPSRDSSTLEEYK